MKVKLVNYFPKISPLTQQKSNGIAESMHTKTNPKGGFLLREGQFSASTFFILQGCAKEYISTDKEEKTTNFFTEEQWALNTNVIDVG